MKVSIITINFNNAIGLKKTIESVINQNDRNFEYIIIDGGSNDESVELIKNNQNNISYWITEKDNGIYHAMNKGIKKATGNYLMFLNSGDCLCEKGIIATCKGFIDNNEKVDIFYGDIYGVNDKLDKPWIHKHPTKLDLLFWEENNINHQSSFIKKTLFNEFGLYPIEYKLAGDHWLFFKCFLAEKLFYHIPVPLITYNYSGVSATSRARYYEEMRKMWGDYLPSYIQSLVIDYKETKFLLQKWPIKMLIKISEKYHAAKNRLKSIM